MYHLPRRFHGNRSHRCFVLAKEGGVDLDGILVLGGDVYIFEDRVHRTDDLALLAIDTHFGIDIELRSSGLRVDAGDRTDFDARSIVGAQTGDDVRHWLIFLYHVQTVQPLRSTRFERLGRLERLERLHYPSGASGKSVRITLAT